MDDTARLAQLHALHVLDSSEEPIFDAIVASAGALFTRRPPAFSSGAI